MIEVASLIMRGSFILAHTENIIQNRKNKHLSSFERGQIAALHKVGHSNRDITSRLGRTHQTIANELKRGTTMHLKTERPTYITYLAEMRHSVYELNRMNGGAKSKLLVATKLIALACDKITAEGWSIDAVVGIVSTQTDWDDKQMVSTNILYSSSNLTLLSVRNIALPMKTKLNTKTKIVRETVVF